MKLKDTAVHIRTYQDNDFYPVLYLFKRHVEYDDLNAGLLNEKLYEDPDWNPEFTLVAEKEGHKLVGFMQGLIKQVNDKRIAYIKLMAVDAIYRRRGIASSMYLRLEEMFRDEHAEAVRIYDVPQNYFMPGIDPRYTPAVSLVKRLGFNKTDDTSNMVVPLQVRSWSTEAWEQNLLKDEVEVRRADSTDYGELMDFIGENWELWKHEVNEAMKDQPPAVHIAIFKGRVKAFSVHNANNKGTGWFGPMGAHADLRGKGLGGVLLFRCLQDIKNQGHQHAIIPWAGPVDFYAHYADARVQRVFWRYEKSLE